MFNVRIARLFQHKVQRAELYFSAFETIHPLPWVGFKTFCEKDKVALSLGQICPALISLEYQRFLISSDNTRTRSSHLSSFC